MNPSRGMWMDALAGLSVAGVLLPEAVAYAGIAGVAPQHALIATLAGLCIYPFWGTSRFAVLAPTSSAAAVFASAMAASAPNVGFALVLVTGIMFLLASALKAGFLGAFISRPVLRGFTWALTLTIVLKQLPHVLGVHVQGTSFDSVLVGLVHERPHWHEVSMALGAGALALWLALCHGLKRWAAVPSSLLVLLAGMGLSVAFKLEAQGVAQVGTIAWHWSWPQWPTLTQAQWMQTVQVAPALLLILFAESWGSVRSLALQVGDTVEANRELLALGAANLVCGALQGLPVGAGFSAASASQAAGARTKLAGLASALALAMLLWWGRAYLALLPQPVLAAVVIGILSHNLWPRTALNSLRQGGDAWLALVAAAGVLLFGILFGMLMAVGLSLLMALRRFAQPVVTELRQLNDSHDFVDCDRHPDAKAVAGTLIVRPEEPLFFANTEQILQAVAVRAQVQSATVVVLSLEMTDDLDTTATEALQEFSERLAIQRTRLLLARVKDRPREALSAYWAGRAQAAPPCFWSVADAVEAVGRF